MRFSVFRISSVKVKVLRRLYYSADLSSKREIALLSERPVSAAAPERDSVQLQHFGLRCDRRSSVDCRDPAAGGELVHVLLDQEERPAAADQDPHL